MKRLIICLLILVILFTFVYYFKTNEDFVSIVAPTKLFFEPNAPIVFHNASIPLSGCPGGQLILNNITIYQAVNEMGKNPSYPGNYLKYSGHHITCWDVSQVTDMSFLFSPSTAPVATDRRTYDDTTITFLQSENINDIDFTNWDTSKVTSMESMFQEATNFNEESINSFNLSNINYLEGMFQATDLFNKDITTMLDSIPHDRDIYMRNMFKDAKAFAFGDKDTDFNFRFENTPTGGTISNTIMFNGADAFKQKYERSSSCSGGSDDGPLSCWKLQTYTSFTPTTKTELINAIKAMGKDSTDSNSFLKYDPSDGSAGRIPISEWDLSKLTDISHVFDVDEYRSHQDTYDFLISRDVNQMGISEWNTSNIQNMSYLFRGCQHFNETINTWNTSNVTNMYCMFKNAYAFNKGIDTVIEDTSGNDIIYWDVSKVTNMSHMFDGAIDFNQSIEKWDTSAVESMGGMFKDAYQFNQPLNTETRTEGPNLTRYISWDTKNVTDMSNMFRGTSSFNQEIGNWNTSNVTSMESMFRDALSFNKYINFKDNLMINNNPHEAWNTSSVVTMFKMFNNAEQFNQDISDWNVSNVQDMRNMFFNAKKFNKNILNWNINILLPKTKFDKMFEGALEFNRKYENDINSCDVTIFSGPPNCWRLKTQGLQLDIRLLDMQEPDNEEEDIPNECKHILINDCDSIHKCKEACKIYDCGNFVNNFLLLHDPANICGENF